jgi:hypothetical protein
MFLRVLLVLALVAGVLSARKSIVIDLTKQEAYAYENGHLVMSGWVSTGKYGHRTPTGHFRILEKDLRHVSSKYPEPTGGARMDYMMRLTKSGIAMHLGYVPNYPASHGCIRLPNGFAQRLYRWAPVGTPVRIKGVAPVRVSRGLDRSRRTHVASSMSSSRSNFAAMLENPECDPIDLLSSVPGKANCLKSSKRRVQKRARKTRVKRRKTLVAKNRAKKYNKRRRIKRIKPSIKRNENNPLDLLRS